MCKDFGGKSIALFIENVIIPFYIYAPEVKYPPLLQLEMYLKYILRTRKHLIDRN